MKKQTALLLSTLVLLSAASMQPANAVKFFHKKEKPAVVAPVKEVAPAKAPEAVVKKEEVKAPAVKAPAAKAPVKPAATPAKPAVKAPVAPVKAPVKPVVKK